MPDARDSYQYLLESSRGLLADMAELAARLGSPNTFVRGGVTVVQDTFSNGLSGWQVATLGSVSLARIKLSHGLQGGTCLHIRNQQSSGMATSVSRYYNIPEYQQIGIEIATDFPTDFGYFDLWFSLGEVDTVTTGNIRINNTTGMLQYRNSGGIFTDFAEIPVLFNELGRFDQMKVIVNLESLEYVSFRFNQNFYSLANQGLRTVIGSGNSSLTVALFGYASTGSIADFYTDYVILTTAEI